MKLVAVSLALLLLCSAAFACDGINGENCSACPSTVTHNGVDTMMACNAVTNPEFNRECAVNVILILDESGSIRPFRDDVVAGAKAFWTALSEVVKIGGSANMAVVEFNSSARIPNIAPGNLNVMRSITDTYVNQLNTYIDRNDNSGGVAGYAPGGCTNWGHALQTARTGSADQNANPGWVNEQNQPIKPDIILFFTDGVPTEHDGNCGKVNTNGANCPPFNSDLGTGCYQAAQVKLDGIKLFLVGVGGVADALDQVRVVTGNTEWDQKLDTFRAADYISTPDFNNLGAIFYSVARGLCPCLQEQPACEGNNCVQEFSARVKITSPPTGATQYSSDTILSARFYLKFGQNPSLSALQFFEGDVSTAVPSIIREDIHTPCQVTRRINCSGGCFLINEQRFVHRFFRESADTPLDGNSPARPDHLTAQLAAVEAAGCTGYLKAATIPGNPGEAVRFAWFRGSGAATQICAAVSNDGTLFEFFTDSNVRGIDIESPPKNKAITFANMATPPAAGTDFDFERKGQPCNAPQCNAPVEIVFVIDEQNSLPSTDYNQFVKPYISTIVDTFTENAVIGFGAYYSNNNGNTNTSPIAIPDLAGDAPASAQVVYDFNAFKSSVDTHNKRGGTTNFGQLITGAIDHFWPDTPASLPPNVRRHMVVIVAGADVGGGIGSANTLRDQRGIETWAIGVGAGALQSALLNSIASQNGYPHSTSLGTPSLLALDAPFLASRLCPSLDLCGGTCGGFCACTNQCVCPPCASTDLCNPRKCSDPRIGCVGNPVRCVGNPCKIACNAATGNCEATTDLGTVCGCPCNNPCENYQCVSGSCQVTADTSCSTKNNICQKFRCAADPADPMNASLCVIDTEDDCDDGNSCTIDKCEPGNDIGCTHVGTICPIENPCQTASCNGTGPVKVCELTTNNSTLDFCKVCKGNNLSCFLEGVTDFGVAEIVSIAVVVPVVIASVIAAALIIFFSAKGYQWYAAKNSLGAANAMNNQMYAPDANAGETTF